MFASEKLFFGEIGACLHALLPLAGDVVGGLVVVHHQEGGSPKIHAVLLDEVAGRSGE